MGVQVPPTALNLICANGSVVEHRLAKARVASSNLVSRSKNSRLDSLLFLLPSRFDQLFSARPSLAGRIVYLNFLSTFCLSACEIVEGTI